MGTIFGVGVIIFILGLGIQLLAVPVLRKYRIRCSCQSNINKKPITPQCLCCGVGCFSFLSVYSFNNSGGKSKIWRRETNHNKMRIEAK